MAKKIFTDESLNIFVDEIKAGDANSLSSAKTYTDKEINTVKSLIQDIDEGYIVVAEATHAESADESIHATSADSATTSESATKATQDASGNIITSTYETKTDASAKLTEAKTYSDTNLSTAKSYTDTAISNLINSAPSTLDTLGEIAAAMEENANVVEALDTAIGTKANASHTHGNITDAGAIGTASGQAVITTTDGVLTTGTVPVTSGGTGATTAADALKNLELTATASEINVLDGFIATTTELNYLDGVTSNIQTQLDNKYGLMKLLKSSDDLDDITDNGIYYYSTSSVPANAPYTNAAIIEVFGANSSSSQKIQRVTRYGEAGCCSFRQLLSGTWGAWREIAIADKVAAASHTHTATDIASGTLSSDILPTVPIAKGGTGATTAAEALINLGITETYATKTRFIRKLDSTDNLDNITEPGLYYWGNGTSAPTGQADDLPFTNASFLEVISDGSYCITQRLWRYGAGGHVAQRTMYGSNYSTKTSWAKFYTTLNPPSLEDMGGDLVGKNVEGETFTVNDTSVTAGMNAEIFNDYTNNIATGNYSHAEGISTTASGNYSHAEGDNTTAKGEKSHTEGYGTTASGLASHAEGKDTTASGTYSHAEGDSTTASGYASHAEGNSTTAQGKSSHAEGYGTTVTNDATITAQTTDSTTAGDYGHAEGYGTIAYGHSSHAEGNGTTASGSYSHAEGCDTTASGSFSHAEGWSTHAEGRISHAEGNGTTASGTSSHAEGFSTTAEGESSHAEGETTTASGYTSHAEGYGTIASGGISHAEGFGTNASGDYSHAGGFFTIANNFQYVVGKYNKDTTAPTSLTDTATSTGLFIVGIGSSDDARNNGFRVSAGGKVYGTGVFGTSGADYAEYFEWFDGNPNNEDRRGRFVTLDGGKIRYATSNDDYILGVVSANPSVAGDIQSESWHDMYLKDIYGGKLVEVVEVEETTNENGEIIPAHTESRWVLNPNYNPNVKYTSREERPEWAAIGIVGKLVVVDDGTCQVNGYCYPNVDGIATASQEKTNYRVMERLDDTHIKIFIK